MPPSRVTQVFTSASRKYRALPYITFLPYFPEEMQRRCLTRSWGGFCRGREQMGWAQLLVPCLLPVQAFPAPGSQASPCQQRLPFWAQNFRKEGSSALTMPPGVICWLAASQQIPMREGSQLSSGWDTELSGTGCLTHSQHLQGSGGHLLSSPLLDKQSRSFSSP